MKQLQKILLYLIPLLLFLPVFLLRDYTPNNELRYVSIIDEAINKGSVVVFTNHGLPYADKPPLYFWIMMIGRLISGDHLMAFMGVVNLLITGIILWVMNRWCFPDDSNPRTLLPPMLTLLTTGLFAGALLVLRMDILMTMFIVLALYTFYKLYSGKGTKDDEVLFPLYMFLALFSKGPVGLIVPVVSILIFLFIRKEIRGIGKYLGWRTWGILLILCGIWFGGVYIEGGKTYLNNLLFHQTIDRAVDSFHHKEPFYFYLTRFWILAAPWSLFCIAIFVKSFRKRLLSSNPLLLFFAVIIISTFVILSLISSKVDIYLLPIYPFFIYFCFLALKEIKAGFWIKAAAIIPMVALCCAVPILLYIEQKLPFDLLSLPLAIVGAVILTGGAIWSLVLIKRKHVTESVGVCTAAILIFIFINSFQIPSFNDYLGMKGIAEKGMELGKKHQTPRFVSFGIGRAENMEVYLGTSLAKVDSISVLTSSEKLIKPYVLFTRKGTIEKNREFDEWLRNKNHNTAGTYEVYLIE